MKFRGKLNIIYGLLHHKRASLLTCSFAFSRTKQEVDREMHINFANTINDECVNVEIFIKWHFHIERLYNL